MDRPTTGPAPASEQHVMVLEDAALAALCREWRGREALALDTEFIRTNTFYPKPGLLQVGVDDTSYLIDPLVIADWSAFRDLMTAPQVTKIFHSCSEDLLVFHSFLGVLPEPLFDTQIAAAFLDQGLSISYQNLVRDKLDVELPKGETCSDWLQRPLSADQLHYAALDVAYLPEIRALQHEQLEREGKLDWFREDCERSLRLYDSEVAGDFVDYYLNIKGAWQLRPRQLAALQKLACWREERARRRDRPRNWLIRDQQLLEVARKLPQTRQQLQEIPEISANFLKYESEAVLRLVREAREVAEEDFPPALPRPLNAEQKKMIKAAQALVQDKARELSMSPDILARKRILLALLYGLLSLREEVGTVGEEEIEPFLPPEMQGWRRQLLLADLLEVMQS